MNRQVRKAVIPAAGFGTRFLPASKIIPKELIPIVDKPTVQYIFEELKEAGIEEFIFIISKGKETLAEHFKPHDELEKYLKEKNKKDLLDVLQMTQNFGKVTFVYQDFPRGLGHAVLCAEKAVAGEPFIVALGDDLIDHPGESCSQQLCSLFGQFGKSMVSVQEVALCEVQKYGIVSPKFLPEDAHYALDSKKRLIALKDLVEKPLPQAAPSRLAIVGRYLLTPEIFPILAKTGQGVGGEIQLTDGLKALNQTHDLYAYVFEGERFDAGDKFGFLQATLHYGLKHPELAGRFKEFLKNLKVN